MNILVISYYPIYPFENGASIAQFGIIEYLSKQCNISLLIPEWKILTDKEFTELKNVLPNVKIYTMPSQSISNTEIPARDIVANIFRSIRNLKNKFKLFFKAVFQKSSDLKDISLVSLSQEEEFVRKFSSNRYHLHSYKYVEKINEIILQDEIEIVQIEFIELLSLVTAIPSNVKKIFIQHDSEISKIKSYINSKQIDSSYSDYILNFYKCIEVSLLEKFDSIITFNNYDALILRQALGNKGSHLSCFVSPYAIPEREFKEIDKKNFLKLDKLTFVGSDGHFPNKDAVEWFLEDTAQEIVDKFGLKLHIVGKWSQDTIKKYQEHPSKVEFLGFVKDLYEISQNSISIAPVRIGGGLRTKIMIAMAQGIPVICTKFALEGIDAKHLESVMIAEDKDSFSWAVEYLLADLERTFLLCQNAQNLIREKYSQSVVSKQRYSIYQGLLQPRISANML
jgi:glycosyltransferase involved in cell wall biosynthesis